VVLVAAVAIAYATSLSGPFLYDDQIAIVKNAQIRTLSPLTVPLSPPRDTPVAGRPVVNLSLAVNYAIGGLDVTSYHVTNVALHVLVALVLFGVVRRTLLLTGSEPLPPRSDGLALACALVWALHPLNTEVVNYTVQRTESLMALCYLTTLYCAIRASARPDGLGWRTAAVAACAAGMLSKESMVTAPLMVLAYDRVFLYPSLGEAWRERRWLYAGLAATWAVLAWVMLGQPRTSAGFATGVSPWTYFLNQLPIIARYLWLVVWPRPLVVDYGLPRAIAPSEVIVPGILLVALAVATLLALRRHKALGFLGVWFFVTLAPTSSVVPIATEVGAERRMYLPLMALVVLAVVGVYRLLVRRGTSLDVERRGASSDAPARAPAGGPEGPPLRVPIAVLTVVCVLLAAGVMLRAREYQSVRSIAQANVDRYPHGRSRLALARELVAVNEHSAALPLLEAAIGDYPPARLGLATELATSGRLADAVVQAREFIRLLPDNAELPTARDLIGRSLALQGQYAAAAEEFRLLAEARPNDPAPRVSIGDALLRQARVSDAIASYEAALRLKPGDPDILLQLGLAYGAAGRRQEATMAFESAAAGRPDDLRLLNLWGRSLAAEGRYMDAVMPMRRVVELAPSDSTAIDNLRVIEDLASRQRAAMPGPVARP
jgi:Flp pilus assembly protein TadD